jgi:hypothetical protein
MLEAVHYVPKDLACDRLVKNVEGLILRADNSMINRSNIYVLPASSEGSSSAEMISLLAKEERFSSLGVNVFTGSVIQLGRLLRKAPSAMVIFVDDFAGSGRQFAGSFEAWKSAVSLPAVTSVLVTVVMCPEALEKVQALGVETKHAVLHGPDDRFQVACKLRVGEQGYAVLASYARELHSRYPYGMYDMGCMTVLYRNSNNNIPYLLRGTKGQRVWIGLFPRADQLSPA